jgi:hypothetical protein
MIGFDILELLGYTPVPRHDGDTRGRSGDGRVEDVE